MATPNPENRGVRLLLRYLVLGLVALVFMFPLVFMIVSSLKPDQQLLATPAACGLSCQSATSASTTTATPSPARRSAGSCSTR
jgi:ABC-type glycerol-3-phosphate transport system permease component